MTEIPEMTLICSKCHNTDHKMTLTYSELDKTSKVILKCDHCDMTYELKGITIVPLNQS